MALQTLTKIYERVKNYNGQNADFLVTTVRDMQNFGVLIDLPPEFTQAGTPEAMQIFLNWIEAKIFTEKERARAIASEVLEETFSNVDWSAQAIRDVILLLMDVPAFNPDDGTLLDSDGTPVEDEHFKRLPTKANVYWGGRLCYDRDGKEISGIDYDAKSPEEQLKCRVFRHIVINTKSYGIKRIGLDDYFYIKILVEKAAERYPALLPRLACELYISSDGKSQGALRPYSRIVSENLHDGNGLLYHINSQLIAGLIQSRTHFNIAVLESLIDNPYQINYNAVSSAALEPYLSFAQAAVEEAAFKKLFQERDFSTYRDRHNQPLKGMTIKGGKCAYVETGTPTTAEQINYLKYLATLWKDRIFKKVIHNDGDLDVAPTNNFVSQVVQMAAKEYGNATQAPAGPNPSNPPKNNDSGKSPSSGGSNGNGNGSGKSADQKNTGK